MPKESERVTVKTFGKLRLVMRIGGLEKNGKTHFALTAPGPIGVLDIDRGLEGVIEKFLPFKEIYAKSFRHMRAETQKEHQERWDAVEAGYYEYLNDPDLRSIIVDTDTEAWEMVRLAEFGKLSGVKSHHYGVVNGIFRKMIDAAFDSDKNVIFISRFKKQYIRKKADSDDAVWNGLFEASGFSEMPALVMANLKATLEGEPGNQTPTIKVMNCRHNMALNGETFEGDLATFSFVAANIKEGTTPEDWE